MSHQTLLTKHKFKFEIIKNFKKVTVKHEAKLRSLLYTGPGVATQKAGSAWKFVRNAAFQPSLLALAQNLSLERAPQVRL